jgi:hypothetical protein
VSAAEFATFWQGPLEPVIHACLSSFPAVGARLRLYAYEDIADAPAGVEVVDARLVIPDVSLLHRYIAGGKPSLATFSDRFRYSLLERSECCWVDADILCLETPDFRGERIVWGRQPEAHGKALINNAVMKLPGDHVVLREMLARAVAAVDAELSWGAIGPFLLTDIAEKHGVYATSRPPHDFYPIGPDEFWRLLLPSCRESVAADVAGATFLHLWSELLRRCQFDFSACPPAGSYLHAAFERLDAVNRFERVYQERELTALLADWLPREPR